MRTHVEIAQLKRSAVVLFSALLAAPAVGLAQQYPSKPIRLIVPYTPAGPTDIHSRAVAQKLSEAWGQPVVVENRPGAAGMIGTEIAAKAAPDGYTLCTAGVSFSTAPILRRDLTFDPVADLTPIALMGALPNILVVHPSLPVKSVRELIAFAKARPKELFYPTGGVGGTQWLAGAYFEHLSKTDMVNVQYRGSIPGITALIAGEVSVGFTDLSTTLPQVKAGKLRLLAVTSAKRSPLVPSVPTVAESGLPGFNVTAWFGLITRAGTPKPVVDKLNREIVKALQMSDTKARLEALGSDLGTMSPDEFGAFIKSETSKWAEVIKVATGKGRAKK